MHTSQPISAIAGDGREDRAESSYSQILKSSALIGGSSLITVAIGVVRTKAMAILLGPSGYGLMGTYLLIADLAKSVAQVGVGSSGVRQIAETAAKGDSHGTSRTAIVLRRISLISAALGAVALIFLSSRIAEISFGNTHNSSSVAWLSIAVFLTLIATGQMAMVQGLRLMSDLAKIGIIGAISGAIASIILVYFFGDRGVVPSIIASAAVLLTTSWWYSRKLAFPRVKVSFDETIAESSSLIKLGFAFMASGLMTLGTSYVVRIMVLRHSGLDAAGLYQAAWTVGGLYVGFVLQAMGTDFYPRLVGVIDDHPKCNQYVNEQAKVSLLLAGPGVIATITFAPLVISLLYSTKFDGAIEILRWISLGGALQVITWPIGYIIVAKNRRILFVAVELAWTIVNIGLTWFCIDLFGIPGAGIAFFGSYIFHWIMIYPIVRRLTGFRWSPENIRLGAMFISSISLVFLGFEFLPVVFSFALAIFICCVSCLLSAKALLKLSTPQQLPRSLRRILAFRTKI